VLPCFTRVPLLISFFRPLATYFIAGFFSNGTIGAGGVANEASIASFLGAYFNSDGSVVYQPEQVPPQGWYRRGTPMFLSEVCALVTAREAR
jgi:hypothetical protein